MASTTELNTMRAVVLERPGPPESLRIRALRAPEPQRGWALIQAKAFGLNRSELHTRLGVTQGVIFPSVLGIEATGVLAAAPGGELAVGQPCGQQLLAHCLLHDPPPERRTPLEAVDVDHVGLM